jgi:hypothetical protein
MVCGSGVEEERETEKPGIVKVCVLDKVTTKKGCHFLADMFHHFFGCKGKIKFCSGPPKS